jgi:hypothetical protein
MEAVQVQRLLPEMLQFDRKRMAAVRDEVDALALISGIIITVKQIQVSQYFVGNFVRAFTFDNRCALLIIKCVGEARLNAGYVVA